MEGIIKKEPIIGVVLGGFCPLHTGHMDIIHKCQKECDYTYVVVCGYDNEPRANEIGMNLASRYSAIFYFLRNTVTTAIMVNDTELGIDESCSLDNWRKWSNEAISRMKLPSAYEHLLPKLNPDDIKPENLVFYVSEEAYKKSLTAIGFKAKLCSRQNNNISGTKCRQNPVKYWNKLTLPFKKQMVSRILITGTASAGKSTMVRDICNYFTLPHAEEYGRDYMFMSGKSDKDLTYDIFQRFIDKQFNDICRKSADAAYGRGVMLSDTDACVTLMYAHEYSEREDFPNINKAEYNTLESVAAANVLANRKNWWKHIFVFKPRPDVDFVDDGTRFMGQSSYEERLKNFNFLMHLIEKYYGLENVTIIDTNSRYIAYLQIRNYINTLMDIN